MKALAVISFGLLLVLSACDGWPAGPFSYNYNPPTPVPSRTPLVMSPTPIILSATPQGGASATFTPETATASTPTLQALTATPETPTLTPTETVPAETFTPSVTLPASSLELDVLGCDTGIDVLHGMGEVTNAYVTIKNATATDASNVCATLSGLDEGRAHPDKTKCTLLLPTGYQVTLKLTVDTTYKQDTPIQVDLMSGETLLQRAGEPGCTAIGLAPPTDQLGVVIPIP